MSATTAAAGATGLRVWLQTRSYGWLTQRRLKRATIGLVVVALAGASVGLHGPSEGQPPAAAASERAR